MRSFGCTRRRSGTALRIPPPAEANRLARCFGCTRRTPGVSCQKFLKDSKGNFFQKVSFGAPPLWHFLFADKGYCPLSIFFCATLLKRKRRTVESDDGMERVTFSFLLCKLHTFTIPQALTRQLPLHKGAFSYFLRTLRECPLLLARVTIGRPPALACSLRRCRAGSLYRGSFLGVRTLQRTFCLFRRARACSRRSLYLIRRYFSELLNNLESSKKRLHAWRDCGTIKAEKRRLFAAVTAETEKENRNGDF